MTTPPRPQWTHPDVKTAAAADIVETVFAWARRVDVYPDDDTVDQKEFGALITAAVLCSVDAYECGRYLADYHDWPCDGELVRYLDAAYLAMPFRLTPVITRWALEHNVRFKAEVGQVVEFTIDGKSNMGTVTAVVKPEAVGFVDVNPKKSRIIRVPAECITSIKMKRAAKKKD